MFDTIKNMFCKKNHGRESLKEMQVDENGIKEIQVDIGGKIYKISSDDEYLNHIENGFEPEMVKMFELLAEDSHVIFDIGANIGCTALLFSELSNEVHAFEPSPSTHSILKTNILKAKKKNVYLHNFGLGNSSFDTTLTFSPKNRSGGFVSNITQASDGHTTEKISIQCLDDVIENLNINSLDFIKMDVEGFEGKVIEGARKTLEVFKPLIVLELNHWCLNAFQRTSIPDFFEFLRSIFPILFAVDGMNYLDLHNESETYTVMYHHIIHNRFPNIIAGFNETKVENFKKNYSKGFTE